MFSNWIGAFGMNFMASTESHEAIQLDMIKAVLGLCNIYSDLLNAYVFDQFFNWNPISWFD